MEADFRRHEAALAGHLVESLAMGGETDQASMSRFVRVLRDGLRMSALSIGGDAGLDCEGKGQLISLVAMLERAISSAWEANLARVEKGAVLKPLNRGSGTVVRGQELG